MKKIFVDANPKQTCYVADDGETRIEVLSNGYTNNEAEYLAILRACQRFQQDAKDACNPILILSDSQLAVNQLNHKWSIKEDRLRNLAAEVWLLLIGYYLHIVWIPRKENLAGKVLG